MGWPEGSPLRIELFSLEMQAVYGSYYRNKQRVGDMIANLIRDEGNRLAYVEAWKYKFRKSQKEAMHEYVKAVSKHKHFLSSLDLKEPETLAKSPKK